MITLEPTSKIVTIRPDGSAVGVGVGVGVLVGVGVGVGVLVGVGVGVLVGVGVGAQSTNIDFAMIFDWLFLSLIATQYVFVMLDIGRP
jgi:hypothetical protein